ncbi:hypothetical protein D3C79_496310 [compost metagenome]
MHKAVNQPGDIFPSFAQRRNREGDDVQAVIQIAPESAILHRLRQIAIGGRHDAHVDLHRVRGADPQHFTLLQHAQQTGLRIQRHFADLIEQQSAAIRQLKFPGGTAPARAGKGAIHVTEKLALHQIARQGAAVNGNEGFIAACAAVVDRLSEQLFAGSALAGQQNGAVAAATAARLGDGFPYAAGMAVYHVKGIAGADSHHAAGDGANALVLAQGEHPAVIRRGHQRNHAGEGRFAFGHKNHFTIVAKRHGQQRAGLWAQQLVEVQVVWFQPVKNLACIAVDGFQPAVAIADNNAFIQRFQNGLLFRQQPMQLQLLADGLRSRLHGAQGVGVEVIRRGGERQHADHHAFSVTHRRRRTLAMALTQAHFPVFTA